MKPVHDFAGSVVLRLTSRFVLEQLPYLLLALAAVVVLPRVFNTMTAAAPDAASPPRQIEATVGLFDQGQMKADRFSRDHAAFAPNRLSREIAKAAEGGPEVR